MAPEGVWRVLCMVTIPIHNIDGRRHISNVSEVLNTWIIRPAALR
jgi:hypothetical protein